MENMVVKNPVKVFTCGSIKVAVWSDAKVVSGTMVELHSIKIDKSYKDGEVWKNTNTFHMEDLPKVAALALEVYKCFRIRTSENNHPGEEK